MASETSEVALEAEVAKILELVDAILAQYRDDPQPVHEADIERSSSQLSTLAGQYVANGNLLKAIKVTRGAADLLLFLKKKDEALEMLSRMETLCHENGDFDGVLECAWRRGKVLVEANVCTEETKAALQRCLAYADQNEEKFRDRTYLDDTRKNAKYYLGKVLHELRDFRNAIPYLMAAEHDEGFDQASVCFNLGLSHVSAARYQTTNTEDIQKTFEVAVAYLRRTFSLNKAKGSTEAVSLAFRAAKQTTDVLFHIKNFRQASEFTKEAALLAKEVEDRSMESTLWWNCGQMMYAEQKYNEALNYFVASLEAALQTTDVQREALVEQAFTWVNNTLLYANGKSKEEVERIVSERVDLMEASLSLVSKVERQAEAEFALGLAKFNSGQRTQGIELLDKALARLSETPCHAAASNRVLGEITFLLAAMHRECGHSEDAATLFQRCETLFESPLKKIECAILRGLALAHDNSLEQSLSGLLGALERYDGLQNSLPNAVAELLCILGLVLKRCGRLEESIQKLKEACKIWEEAKANDQVEVPLAYMGLFEAYIMKQEYWQAFEVAKLFQPVLEQYHQEDATLLRWKALQGTGYMLMADFNLASVKYLTTALGEAKDKGHWELQVVILGNLARTYRGLKNYDSALSMYEELEELLSNHEGPRDYFLLGAEMSINRAEVYMQKGTTTGYLQKGDTDDVEEYYKKALESYENATKVLVCHPFTDGLQARAYAGQAVVLHNLGIATEVEEITEKALKLAGQDRILIAKLNHIQAYRFWEKNEFDKAIEVAQRAALCFVDVQIELQDLESAWITFFGNDMKHMFILLQRIYVDKKEYTKALLWAERGRMRLFQSKVGNGQSSQHLEVCNNNRGASSSTCQRSRLTVKTRSNEPPTEICADDLHQLELLKLTPGKKSEGGTSIGMKASESRSSESYLIMKGKNSGDSDRESRHIMCESYHELRCPEVEVSEINDKFCTCLVDNQKAQEDSATRLEEAATCELFNAGVLIKDPLWFDKDDNLAENLIFKTLEACGKGAAIIEYMYADAEQLLITYVVVGGAERMVHCHYTLLPNFFKEKEISKLSKSLRILIGRTLTTIKSSKEQDKALSYLQILHTLLLAPISEHIVDCNKLIFVPHEVLNRIPFAALHDGKEFLIQGKSVSIIPSIRSLHHCLVKQQAFENAWKNGAVGLPFVAGNPEPMGLHLGQLRGAAKEAEEVAELLGVTAITGQYMTKEAVVKGLGNGCLSVLITHGIFDPGLYPYGALVLQGLESKLSISNASTLEAFGDGPSAVRSSSVGLLGGMNLERAVATASEVITAEEVVALPGGIPAGLVVLSACETGEGEVTSEGLLGLGRAVLQAGASAVLVSYWKVDDDSTKDLMTGLFTVLVKEGKTVAEALQSAMLRLLQDGSYKPYHWAPFVVLGSPFIKILESKRTSTTSTSMDCKKMED